MPDQAATQMVSKMGPALSATSDTPVGPRPAPAVSAVAGKGNPDVALTNAPAVSEQVDTKTETGKDKGAEENSKEAKTAADEGKTTEEADDADAGDEATEGKTRRELTPEEKREAGVKREITKERNRRREAETKAAATEAQLATALKSIEQLTGKNAAEAEATAAAKDPRPKREQFGDPDAYDTALIEWTTRTATRTAEATAEQKRAEDATKTEKENTEKQQTEQAETFLKEWTGKRDAALEKYPDYEAVAESDDVQVTRFMADAIMAEDNGPDIAYHLGSNPKEAERISKLSPIRQIAEIGRLAMKIEAKEKTSVSKAPPPARPLGSRQQAAEKSPAEESMDEYAARRNAQLRGKKTT